MAGRIAMLFLLLFGLAGCTPVLINDDGSHHLLFKVDGMNNGVLENANQIAAGRCAQYNKEVTAPTVHKVGWLMPTWYIEYDCVTPNRS